MNATTTCSYTTPLDGNGNPPVNQIDVWNYASSSCQTTYGYSSSTDASYAGGISYGNLVIATFLFLILSCAITITYFLHFRKVRIKN